MSRQQNWPAWIIFTLAVSALAALGAAREHGRNEPQPPSTEKVRVLAPAPIDLPMQYELVGKIDPALDGLRGISIGPDDEVYLAGADAVKVLTAEGKPLRDWTISEEATCVDVDADGNVYVGYRTRVDVFDSRGRLIRS